MKSYYSNLDNWDIELYEIDLINSENSLKEKKSWTELHFRFGEFPQSEVFNGTVRLKKCKQLL